MDWVVQLLEVKKLHLQQKAISDESILIPKSINWLLGSPKASEKQR